MRWSKKEVIYQILVDRFSPVDAKKAKKPIFAGGTFSGITKKIPYFVDLGVTAIWLTPFLKGTSYHGYHTTDFMEVDPHFGSKEDLKKLIVACHNKNIKIMMDFVPNHVSSAHPFFQMAIHENNKEFAKWFYIDSKKNYECFFDYKEMPKLNLDHQMARNYVITAAQYWLSLGIDGLRLDHAIGPSINFWKEFSSTIKRTHPDCLLLGEVWADKLSWKQLKTTRAKHKFCKYLFKATTENYMKDYQEVFDGCLDFTFNKLLREYVFEHESKKEFSEKLHKHYLKFDKKFILPVFLDNHDMDRFYLDCKGRHDYKKAIDMMFAQDQPVVIYYGDESGMSQEKHFSEFSSYGDLQARQPMNWENMDAELVEYWKAKIAQKLK